MSKADELFCAALTPIGAAADLREYAKELEAEVVKLKAENELQKAHFAGDYTLLEAENAKLKEGICERLCINFCNKYEVSRVEVAQLTRLLDDREKLIILYQNERKQNITGTGPLSGDY